MSDDDMTPEEFDCLLAEAAPVDVTVNLGRTHTRTIDYRVPTRGQLMYALHDQGAYCGDCDYESGHLTESGFTSECKWCERVLGKYADAVLALIHGSDS